MGDRAAKDALYEGFDQVAKAMASGRRDELVNGAFLARKPIGYES